MFSFVKSLFTEKPESIEDPAIALDATHLFRQQQYETHSRTDRLFGILFVIQYILGVIFALCISPKTWIGETSTLHIHIWVACILEAIVISFPLFLIATKPGEPITRHSVAVAQAITSGVFIHLTGGRIETHFHVFGSLAFLAFYQDWRVLVTATLIVTFDHILRGVYWPQSVYGVLELSNWRWVEHAAWILFEDIFLVYACHENTKRMWKLTLQQAEAIKLNKDLSREMALRKQSEEFTRQAQRQLKGELTDQTIQLAQTNMALEKELAERKKLQSQLIQSQKMESIGQLAAGVAHEINNPIGFVMSNMNMLKEYTKLFKQFFEQYQNLSKKLTPLEQKPEISEDLEQITSLIQKEDFPFILSDIDALLGESQEGAQRVQDIVKNLKSFARLDETDYKESNIHDCLETTLKIAHNELKYKCTVIKHFGEVPNIYCNPGQLNQVFMNLLVNAAHAIEEKGEITIETSTTPEGVCLRISDNGMGIPQDKLAKIFDPFYTTKPVGQGTGLGLAITYGIVESHGGSINVSSEVGKGTTFTVTLPLEGKHPSTLAI